MGSPISDKVKDCGMMLSFIHHITLDSHVLLMSDYLLSFFPCHNINLYMVIIFCLLMPTWQCLLVASFGVAIVVLITPK